MTQNCSLMILYHNGLLSCTPAYYSNQLPLQSPLSFMFDTPRFYSSGLLDLKLSCTDKGLYMKDVGGRDLWLLLRHPPKTVEGLGDWGGRSRAFQGLEFRFQTLGCLRLGMMDIPGEEYLQALSRLRFALAKIGFLIAQRGRNET